MIPEKLSDLVEVTLADGSVRHLRFTLGARKRICEKFGAEATEILTHAPEVLIPCVLLEGLVERDGVSEETILDTLVTSPMTDYVMEQFTKAFFPARVAANIGLLIEATRARGEKALQVAITRAVEPSQTVQ